METIQCISARRSVRRYKPDMPDKKQLDTVFSAAALAPSWKNSQTVSYRIVMDPELKRRLCDQALSGKNSQTAQSAPIVVVMLTKTGVSGFNKDGSYTTNKNDGWQMFDAGVACQTLCLAAKDQELDTVIMGIYDDNAVRNVLGIGSEQMVTALVAMGYADEKASGPPKKTIDELVEYS